MSGYPIGVDPEGRLVMSKHQDEQPAPFVIEERRHWGLYWTGGMPQLGVSRTWQATWQGRTGQVSINCRLVPDDAERARAMREQLIELGHHLTPVVRIESRDGSMIEDTLGD